MTLRAHDALVSLDTAPRESRREATFRRKVHALLGGLEWGSVAISERGTSVVLGRPGTGPSAALTIHDPRVYGRLVLGGSVGAGEAYVDGQWSTDDLVALIRILIRNRHVMEAMEGGLARVAGAVQAARAFFQRNTREGSRRNIAAHYDASNDFFSLFLDDTMMYSAAVFERADTPLRAAQEAKLDLICQKVALHPDDHLLEIGTGWGGFALHAARKYGCRVTTTTISREQHALATRRIQEAGLGDRVTVLLSDYRDLTGTYDKLVSIEMIEAVGHDFMDTFVGACSDRLKPDGLAVIQAITIGEADHAEHVRSVDFIKRYIFPGSCLPSIASLSAAVARSTDLRPFHLEELSPHYALTLRIWRERLLANASRAGELGFDRAALRSWEYYLAYCEAGMLERYIGSVQLVLTKPRCRREPIGAPLRLD